MKIGIPKEIKNNENRVGMTPAGVAEFIRHGHEVMVQHTAGENSGFADEAYEKVGAIILPDIQSVYREAEMIVKVKEPIAEEYPLIHQDQLVFTYFHFACDKELTDAMLKSGAVCLAYETVETDNHHLPLLIPMSEVAGRMAAGMGADVWITDISLPRLRQLEMELPINVHTLYSNEHNIRRELTDVDIVVGSVLVPGDKAPHLITKDMLKLMEPGTVLVDVAIDQGGCFETSHPTTHSDPTYMVDGIVHYAVANIPGAVPNTSTTALTNATLKYALALADKGWRKACKEDKALYRGLNIVNGKVVFKAVADVFGLEYEEMIL